MKTRACMFGAGAAVMLAFGGAAEAATIANGSFEGGPTAGGNQEVLIGGTAIPGWTVVNQSGTTTSGGKSIAWLGDGAYGFNTPFSTDYLDLTGYSGSTDDSGVAQTIATEIGAAYRLSFYVGGYQGYGPNSVRVSAGGQQAVLSDPITDGITAGRTVWTLQNFDFTATSASTMLSIVGINSGQDFIGLDNVSISGGPVVAAVPEPASWAMMIIGLGMVGTGLRYRKRKTALRYI